MAAARRDPSCAPPAAQRQTIGTNTRHIDQAVGDFKRGDGGWKRGEGRGGLGTGDSQRGSRAWTRPTPYRFSRWGSSTMMANSRRRRSRFGCVFVIHILLFMHRIQNAGAFLSVSQTVTPTTLSTQGNSRTLARSHLPLALLLRTAAELYSEWMMHPAVQCSGYSVQKRIAGRACPLILNSAQPQGRHPLPYTMFEQPPAAASPDRIVTVRQSRHGSATAPQTWCQGFHQPSSYGPCRGGVCL